MGSHPASGSADNLSWLAGVIFSEVAPVGSLLGEYLMSKRVDPVIKLLAELATRDRMPYWQVGELPKAATQDALRVLVADGYIEFMFVIHCRERDDSRSAGWFKVTVAEGPNGYTLPEVLAMTSKADGYEAFMRVTGAGLVKLSRARLCLAGGTGGGGRPKKTAYDPVGDQKIVDRWLASGELKHADYERKQVDLKKGDIKRAKDRLRKGR